MPLNRTATFKSLMTFRALYENNNASKAAVALGITQSGVSRSLALLEKQLQFDLFIRDKNRLIATPEADSLYSELSRMTGALLELEQNISSIRDFGTSRIRFSATPALALGYAPRVIANAFSGMKNSNIIFSTQASDDIVRSVESGFTDIGFVTLPIETSTLKIRTIIQAPVVCILPKNHPYAKKEEITIEDFAHQHLVVVSEPNSGSKNIIDLLKAKGVRPLSRTECTISAMHCFVANNMGIGIVNTISASESLSHEKSPGVVIKPFTEDLVYEFALIYRPEWGESRTVERLTSAIEDIQFEDGPSE